jgi:hypothetical protein
MRIKDDAMCPPIISRQMTATLEILVFFPTESNRLELEKKKRRVEKKVLDSFQCLFVLLL